MSLDEERYEQIYRDLPEIKRAYLQENWSLDKITQVFTMSDTVDPAYRASLYRILRKEGVRKPRKQTNQCISSKLTGAHYRPRKR